MNRAKFPLLALVQQTPNDRLASKSSVGQRVFDKEKYTRAGVDLCDPPFPFSITGIAAVAAIAHICSPWYDFAIIT